MPDYIVPIGASHPSAQRSTLIARRPIGASAHRSSLDVQRAIGASAQRSTLTVQRASGAYTLSPKYFSVMYLAINKSQNILKKHTPVTALLMPRGARGTEIREKARLMQTT